MAAQPFTTFGGFIPTLTRSTPRQIALTWLGCDLVTGKIVCELPQLTPQGPISRRLGETVNAQFNLELDASIDPGWSAATQPGRSMIVCVLQGQPIWAGIVIGPRQGGSSTTVTINTISPEGYLDRRYVGDHVENDSILAVDAAAMLLGDAQGTNSFITIDAQGSQTLATPAYAGSNDQTVWASITALMESGYPEVCVDVEWTDTTQTAVQLIARVRDHVGYWDLASGPRAVFDLPGCITTYSQIESYESGKGATSVLAEGNGESTSRILSPLTLATAELAAGWPLWEYRWTPQQASASEAALTLQATNAIGLMAEGSSIWTVAAAASESPLPGIDFDLGDRVGLYVAPADPTAGWAGSPRHPQGVNVQARAWGWDLAAVATESGGDYSVTPILAEDSEAGY